MIMKKISATKKRMIQAAFDLFHARGIRQTSVDDILKATKTGKSQFYHYFGSKDGLIADVIQYVTGWTKQAPSDTPYPYTINTWQELESWFGFFVSMQEYYQFDRSCPLMTIGVDLDTEQDTIRQKIKDITRHMYHQITAFFEQEKRKGILPDTVDAGHLAQFAFTTLQGGLLLAKVERDNTALKNAIALYFDYLEQQTTIEIKDILSLKEFH